MSQICLDCTILPTSFECLIQTETRNIQRFFHHRRRACQSQQPVNNSTPSSLGLSAQNGDGHGQHSGKSPYELLKSTKSRWFKTTPGQKVESVIGYVSVIWGLQKMQSFQRTCLGSQLVLTHSTLCPIEPIVELKTHWIHLMCQTPDLLRVTGLD